MSKYRVGDIVKVRDSLENLKKYGGLTYIEEMYGEALEIAEVGVLGQDWYRVYVGQDTPKICPWFYSEEMFEGLVCDCVASKSEPERVPACTAAEAAESGRISFRLDENLEVIFIRVGHMTVCVPVEAPMDIARKNPKDEECAEIGEALAYQRMILQSVAKEDK